MGKELSIDEIKKAIIDYVKDERKTQAVLLDGDWGCGKTFFVKEYLEKDLGKLENTNVIKISLYGVSEIETIQDMIYAKWLESYVAKHSKKYGEIGQLISNGGVAYGKTFVRMLEKKIGFEGISSKVARNVINGVNAKNNARNVIIFDDVERCCIDIIELMGFLNNLAENSGYRIILIANEKEINRPNNPAEDALKYLVALKHIELYKDNNSGNTKNGYNSEVDRCKTAIFGDESVYERTKEKLVGLTIPYNIPVYEIFGDIANKYILKEDIKSRVVSSKDAIMNLLERYKHRNLRTLITAFIAIEDILSYIQEEEFEDRDLLDNEINTVIIYVVYSAMRMAMGLDAKVWPNDTRFGTVNNDDIWNPEATRVYGYAFVDEYWRTQCIEKDVIIQDINSQIRLKKARIETQDYYNLALFKLKEWYMLDDEEVQKLIRQLKEELTSRKYKEYDFKDIIILLMRINNPDYGMGIRQDNDNMSDGVYESTEGSSFKGMEYEEGELTNKGYKEWQKVEIEEYVKLMVAYFEDKSFSMTKDMIRVISEDKKFAYNYRVLTMPILEKIEKCEIERIIKNENGVPLDDLCWDASLRVTVKEKNQEYLNQGRFLSLFDFDKLVEHISRAKSGEIQSFCDALGSIYSFSNLGAAYAADSNTLSKLLEYIQNNEYTKINSEKSRTKKIALVRLVRDLQKYNRLMKNNS